MLRIDTLTYRIGGRVLLDQATTGIDAGQRVGLVGRNGTGKTTLLRLITGELEPDGGAITMPPRWVIGITRQEAPGGDASLIATVLAADAELARLTRAAETADDPHHIADIHERLIAKDAHAAEGRAARILAGLGFSQEAQQQPCRAFSGGWRMRVALAGLLFTRPDLLLLDEPTNHLDLEATLWLENHLRHYPGTVLLVSHDRGLLNRAVDRILHLEGGKLTLYQGGYDRFERTRREQAALDEKRRARQEAERAHIQAFVDRFRAKATKARQAQSRLKMLARMEPIAAGAAEEAAVRFDFPAPEPPLPSPLYAVDDGAIGYDGRPVLRDLNLRLDADDRIALLGANGNGKSTLIKLLAGRLPLMAGEERRPGKLRIGYFAQHQTDELDVDANPILELARRRPDDPPLKLRSHLGRFGFSQERAETRIGDLSGGEKARLLFALMSSAAPHLLLLDEPTNHLDVISRQALIEAINGFAGAVILVSHDPHLLELTADRLWLLADGRVNPFEGDLEDYRTMLLSRSDRAGTGPGHAADPAPPTASEPSAFDRKAQRRAAAERRQALAPLRRRVADLEDRIARLEAEKATLTQRLADPALYAAGGDAAVGVQVRLAEVDKALAVAEEAWGELQETLDRSEAAAS
ncbi:MAG: ABC transporter ATP-binding protein [Rhodospirillales bacterium]|nr:MAG: ABC transporter ATP-binding protein [Rhodospirillales bacterium]